MQVRARVHTFLDQASGVMCMRRTKHERRHCDVHEWIGMRVTDA